MSAGVARRACAEALLWRPIASDLAAAAFSAHRIDGAGVRPRSHTDRVVTTYGFNPSDSRAGA